MRRTKHQALQSMLDKVKDRMEKEPLLVFIAGDDQESIDSLEDMMR